MKKFKKLAASLLAMVMVMAMMAPAFATENKIYLKVPAGSEGHSYNVYQIFTGTVAKDRESFEEGTIDWGEQANPADIVKALKGIKGLSTDYFSGLAENETDANKVAAALRPARGKSADEKLIAQALKDVAVTGGAYRTLEGTEAEGGNQCEVEAGYYLINDTSDEDGLVLVQVTKTLPFQLKSSKAPSMYKKVKNAAGQWVDATDYEIGDEVPFRLVATLPSGYEKMEHYSLTFHDDLSEAFTLPEGFSKSNVTITYYDKGKGEVNNQGEPVGTGTALQAKDWTLTYTGTDIAHEGKDAEFKCDFHVSIDDAKGPACDIRGLADGSVIVVEYTATLNGQANIGNPGNLNTAWVTDDKDNNTPKDPVGVFTFDLGITKTNADGSVKLDGAKFTLEKKNAAGEWVEIDTFAAEQVEVKDGDGNTVYEEGTSTPKMQNGPLFKLDSLTAGDYRLTETEAPAGYTGLGKENPIEFTVSYEVGTKDGKPTLTAVTVVTNNADQTLAGNPNAPIDEDTTNDIVITGSITNYTGTKLPETGGIGTTIFYILGGALAVGAVVLLITKRRVGSSDDE